MIEDLLDIIENFCTEQGYTFVPMGGVRPDSYDVPIIEVWHSEIDMRQLAPKGMMRSGGRNASSVQITERIPVPMLFPKTGTDTWKDVRINAVDAWLEFMQTLIGNGFDIDTERGAMAAYTAEANVEMFSIEMFVKMKY